MSMKLRTVLLVSFLTLFLAVPSFAQERLPKDTGGEPVVKGECFDGINNDPRQDTLIDSKDPQCVTGLKCEDGTSNCLSVGTDSKSCGSGLCLNIAIKNPLKVDTIQEAIKLFMDAVLKIAIPFIVLAFLWSGFNFVLARGNSEKVTKAKNMFVFTIIGTLLILGAWTITNAIIGTVNSITS